MKMTVVGCEASGKTVFMSALADYYNGTGDRPCLVPENPAANNFQRFQLRQMRSLRQWPPATDPGKTIELKWSLRRDGAVISEIEMLEFGGEIFREAFRGDPDSATHQEAVNILTRQLAASESVVLLVSLKDLLRDQSSMSSEEFERDTEALWVTRGLLDFLTSRDIPAKIVIGLTQADVYRHEIEAAGGATELFRNRWPSVAAVANGLPVIPVASVSATDDNGNPAPDYTTDGILPVMEELKKAKSMSKSKGSGSRRALLLLLLLSASIALWFQYANPLDIPFAKTTSIEQTVVKTNVVENTVTMTNYVETTHVTEEIVTLTNVIENIVTRTNLIENTVTMTNFVEQALPPVPAAPPSTSASTSTTYRTWHDHRGAPITARWISTAEDRKRIVLETEDGKHIRALIRKFSEQDRMFIEETLNSATNTTDASTQPAL